ncbi:MAG: hypothetical protein HY329_05040 [Chloroflexi bacterium]|nr:hypothetical protein [Chloroflexota bacterium]
MTFPTTGGYLLFSEFVRTNGQDVLQRGELQVGGVAGRQATLAEDLAAKTIGYDRVGLRAAGELRAGREASLTFRIEDARTGQPVTDLKPYLGAPAHVVILDESAKSFAHTHGEAVGMSGGDNHAADASHSGHGGTEASYGPEIAFHHTFPAPGQGLGPVPDSPQRRDHGGLRRPREIAANLLGHERRRALRSSPLSFPFFKLQHGM